MKSINALLDCITTTANAVSSSIVATAKVTGNLTKIANQQTERLSLWSQRTYKETSLYSQKEETVMPLRIGLEQCKEEKKLLEECASLGLDPEEVIKVSKSYK